MKRIFVLAMIVVGIVISLKAWSQEREVPEVIAFRSLLVDDGGNPLPDGNIRLIFRITDGLGNILYEEMQDVDSMRGQVAALVGNGLSADGAPMGGIPRTVLNPGEPRYLDVEAKGYPPTGPMEIASVPYSIYASEALGIADGSVRFEDLNEELFADLAPAILEVMATDSSAAASIGVSPGFANSQSTELQGVLEDLDRAIGEQGQRIVDEANARTVKDNTQDVEIGRLREDAGQTIAGLQATLNGEVEARVAAVSAEVQVRSEADLGEIQKREAADRDINRRIDNLDPAVSPPPRPELYANAWCTIASCAGGNIISDCVNAQVIAEGVGRCRIIFAQAMASASYAVVTTPSLTVRSKGAGDFIAECGATPSCGFDFIAMGR